MTQNATNWIARLVAMGWCQCYWNDASQIVLRKRNWKVFVALDGSHVGFWKRDGSYIWNYGVL